jgi:hypothetical protein
MLSQSFVDFDEVDGAYPEPCIGGLLFCVAQYRDWLSYN